MSREDNLKQLEERHKVTPFSEGVFSEVFDEKIDNLKDVLGKGIELINVNEVIDALELIQNFHREVKELKEAIKAMSLPDSLEVKGIDELKSFLERPAQIPNIENKIINTNLIDEYRAANGDELDDTNNYYGFVHATGKWYILWINGGATSAAYKYSTGLGDYAKGWASRKKLAYSRFDEVQL